jgi:hypothetical protein
MALQKKIDDTELALLEVIEDPVWLSEFLRSTNNGDMNKNNWPAEEFTHRPYQKEILTDQNKHIVITGGRSIGKCQPASSKIYTAEGFKTISTLLHLNGKGFLTYAYDTSGNWKQRRAVITKDKWTKVHKFETSSGLEVECTYNHPILTTNGFVVAGDLKIGDLVGVANNLPTNHCNNDSFSWFELRLMGYDALNGIKLKGYMGIKPRFTKIAEELKFIADNTFLVIREDSGVYYLERIKTGQTRHYLLQLRRETGTYGKRERRIANLEYLKTEKLDNIKVFLEAVFAQYGKHELNRVSIEIFNERYANDFRELLMYFGINTKMTPLNKRREEKHNYKFDDTIWLLETLDPDNAHRFWSTFKLPGVQVSSPKIDLVEPAENVRWEPIVKRKSRSYNIPTYAVHVYSDETYISDYIVVHNSVIVEDLLTYQIVNNDIEFPKTSEQLLTTPNTNQLTPLLDRVIMKFTTSPLLKDFLGNNVNRSKGTLDFKFGDRSHRFYARIAGSRESNNLVGLHIPKITGDEMQLFSMTAFNQLQPTLNTWEDRVQEVYVGVPNGLRNSALFDLDIRRPKFKKYRIPAPNNPYFTLDDWNDSLRKYGGIEEDIFQQLVLGKHGSASFQVIPRDAFTTEPFDFYSFRFSNNDKSKGRKFEDVLKLQPIKDQDTIVFGIDTGFTDPTLIHIIGIKDGIYRTFVRHRLTKIDYPEQERVIHYLTKFYNPSKITIDVGAGGGGAGIVQSLLTREDYAGTKYAERVVSVLFNERVPVGRTDDDSELTEVFRSWGSKELARIIAEGQLVFSEIDVEGISQLERLTRQKRITGNDNYFIMSERGSGASDDDHIFASYLCFIYGQRSRQQVIIESVRLGRPAVKITER